MKLPELFEIDVEYRRFLGGIASTTLLILVSNYSIKAALTKAAAVIKRNRIEWPKARIAAARHKGQIDG